MSRSKTFVGIVVLLAFFAIGLSAQTKKNHPKGKYDAKLAEKLGADQYGMKSYVMIVLKTGPNDSKITDKAQRGDLFKGHFANMTRLAKEGKLVFAGPFIDGRPKRGLWILAVETVAEAEKLIKTDPTVSAGVFVYEMTKLYGSAALMQVGEIHERIQKTSVN